MQKSGIKCCLCIVSFKTNDKQKNKCNELKVFHINNVSVHFSKSFISALYSSEKNDYEHWKSIVILI